MSNQEDQIARAKAFVEAVKEERESRESLRKSHARVKEAGARIRDERTKVLAAFEGEAPCAVTVGGVTFCIGELDGDGYRPEVMDRHFDLDKTLGSEGIDRLLADLACKRCGGSPDS